MATTPEKYCPHRKFYSSRSGETTEQGTTPLCNVLLMDGSHSSHCKALDTAGVNCPIPLVANGEITVSEGADWLEQIQASEINSTHRK